MDNKAKYPSRNIEDAFEECLSDSLLSSEEDRIVDFIAYLAEQNLSIIRGKDTWDEAVFSPFDLREAIQDWQDQSIPNEVLNPSGPTDGIIYTSQQYKKDLVDIERLLDSTKKGIEEGDGLEIILDRAHDYEEKNFPIG
jgi:hypothetical protein